ncbi:MAG: hypothetical protein LUG84_01130 [Akkermansiaceae bacterium]|nr:hypothetical protein [Akkermansiaceae bacterium]MCD8070667.1 hypothetical protein [Akkermansiaceae bacterium]
MTDAHQPPKFIHCEGVLEQEVSRGAFRARLPNGKPVIAFVEKGELCLRERLRPGKRVSLTLCPADFERARITAMIGEEG